MVVCPKCSCTTIQIAQGSSRCSACGHQERGVSRTNVVHQTFQSFNSPTHQVYNRSVIQCEDVEELDKVWKERSSATGERPLVSIIMPTYKRDHTIQWTIGSILNQTFTAWELILIDNEPEHEYKFTDSRIRYFKHSEERGAAYGRNIGIQYIMGDYVAFFDDDDIMDPHYLECMVAPFLERSDVNMTHCRIKLVEGIVTDHGTFCTPSAIVKRQFVTPVWQKSTSHDRWFFGDIAEHIPAESVVNIPEVLVNAYTSARGGIREGEL